MTAAYDPHADWAREDRAAERLATATAAFTADDLRAAFLALDVRTISAVDMWALIAGRSSFDDYCVALDVLRRENQGKGFDVKVDHINGTRQLIRTALTI